MCPTLDARGGDRGCRKGVSPRRPDVTTPGSDRKLAVSSQGTAPGSPGSALGPRATRGGTGPALGRAGEQGAGAPSGLRGGGATPGRQGPLWGSLAGPRYLSRGPSVPLEHGLAGLAG